MKAHEFRLLCRCPVCGKLGDQQAMVKVGPMKTPATDARAKKAPAEKAAPKKVAAKKAPAKKGPAKKAGPVPQPPTEP